MKNILILGWFGAKNYQLNKFCNLYKSLGYNVIYEKIEIYKSINPKTWNSWNPINSNYYKKFDYVHIFSGGILKYNYLTLNYDFNHSKIIFDSSPLFPTPYQLSNYAFNYSPNNNKKIFKSNNDNHPINKFIEKYMKYVNNYDVNLKSQEFNKNINCGREKLLIISKNDLLLDHNMIDEQIKIWRNKNIVLRPEEFNKNKHIDHYKNNPELYKETIFRFLNN